MTTKQQLDINYLLDVWPTEREVVDRHGHNMSTCPIYQELIKRGHKLWSTSKVRKKNTRVKVIATFDNYDEADNFMDAAYDTPDWWMIPAMTIVEVTDDEQ